VGQLPDTKDQVSFMKGDPSRYLRMVFAFEIHMKAGCSRFLGSNDKELRLASSCPSNTGAVDALFTECHGLVVVVVVTLK
jgi:hypothetical protein